jgi:hypothetical protein
VRETVKEKYFDGSDDDLIDFDDQRDLSNSEVGPGMKDAIRSLADLD